MNITQTTKRLTLRPFNLNDVNNVYELLKDNVVSKTTLNIPVPYKLEDAEYWIKKQPKDIEEGTTITWAIVDKESDELYGCISLMISKRHSRGELGYWLGEKYWGKGYCTEATKEIIEFSFNGLKLNRVMARYSTVNPASGKVMLKAGMKKEGCLKQEVMRNDGIFHDLVVYGLVKEDYSS